MFHMHIHHDQDKLYEKWCIYLVMVCIVQCTYRYVHTKGIHPDQYLIVSIIYLYVIKLV